MQTVSLSGKDSVIEALLHLCLEENVQLSLELVLSVGGEGSSSGLLLDHLGSKTENGLLQPVAKFKVLRQLGEVGEELLAASLGQLLLVAGLHHQGLLGLEQASRRLSLLLFLRVHLLVFSADLLDDEMESILKLADGLFGAGELGHFRVLARESCTVGLDHVEVRRGVEGLTKIDSDVDVGLLLHEDVLNGGIAINVFFSLSLTGRTDELGAIVAFGHWVAGFTGSNL